VLDWLALWGAFIGTAGAAIAVRREVLISRARLRMEHGVWYLLHDRPPDLNEAWVTIQVWNDGGQPLTIERIGLDFTPMWLEGEGDNELLVIGTEVCQAEIELGGEQIELRPGGPSRRFFAPLLGLIQAGIDVLESPARPWVKTSNQKRWEGDQHPVVPDRVSGPFRDAIKETLSGQGAGAPVGGLRGPRQQRPAVRGQRFLRLTSTGVRSLLRFRPSGPAFSPLANVRG